MNAVAPVASSSAATRMARDGTLQEAADNLVARMTLALCLRSGSGVGVSADGPALDLRWLSFLHELGELAASGIDIREWLFAAGKARRAA